MIAVIGLGRVGLVTAARLAGPGRRVLGVESDAATAAAAASGEPPYPEPGLAAALRRALSAGRLEVVSSLRAAASCSAVVVCVGTPPGRDGAARLGHVRAVLRALGRLPGASRRLIAVRSTMAPGSLRSLAGELPPAARARLLLYPEFTREGSAWRDGETARLVLGGERAAAAAFARAAGLPLKGARLVSWETAELIKTGDNAFHALKAAFANELGALAAAFGADGEEALAALRADRVRNASAAYLRPGDAFGGPCLGKDARALAAASRKAGVPADLLEGALRSNARRLDALAARAKGRRVAVLGLEFKRGTGDLRGSIVLEVARRLAAGGAVVTAWDPSLRPGSVPARGLRAAASPEEAVRGASVVLLGPGAGARERRAAAGRKVVAVR